MSNRVGSGSVSVTSAATQIIPANNNRTLLILTKNSTQDMFLGCNVTTSTTSSFQYSGACGTMLNLGEFRGALWGITGAGATVVTYLEITQ